MIKATVKEKLIKKLKKYNVDANIDFYVLNTEDGRIPAAKFFVKDEYDGLCEDHFSYENNKWSFTGREQY